MNLGSSDCLFKGLDSVLFGRERSPIVKNWLSFSRFDCNSGQSLNPFQNFLRFKIKDG